MPNRNSLGRVCGRVHPLFSFFFFITNSLIQRNLNLFALVIHLNVIDLSSYFIEEEVGYVSQTKRNHFQSNHVIPEMVRNEL